MKAFKIMERSPDGFKTLFHANHGVRVIPINVWLEAQIRESIQDGSGGTPSEYMKRQDMSSTILSNYEMNKKIAELAGVYDVNPFKSRSVEGVFVSNKVTKEVSCVEKSL